MRAVFLLLLGLGCARTQGAERVSSATTTQGKPGAAPVSAPVAESLPTKAPEDTVKTTPMQGPYASIEGYCEWLFRTSERFNPVAEENTCTYQSLTPGKGAIQNLQVVYATYGDPATGQSMGGEYHLAMQTARGWFVTDEHFVSDISDGAAGSYFQASVSLQSLTVEDLFAGGAVEAVFRARVKVERYCTACETEAERKKPRRWSDQEAMVVCGVGESETPSCFALRSVRDEDGKRTRLSFSIEGETIVVKDEALFPSVYQEEKAKGAYRVVFP